jgi:hypothetical protein
MPVPRGVTNQFEAELHEGDRQLLRANDWEEFQSEDSLGCARGVLWSLVFEAALVFAGAIFWIIRLTL